jgi:energy-coupling factor transporter ATP-binding protein EcfA2
MPPLTGFRATFRCLRDVEMDFTSPEDGKPSPFIAMVGANGAGKTTVLEAIAQSTFYLINHAPAAGILCEGERIALEYSEGLMLSSLHEESLVHLPDGTSISMERAGRWRVDHASGGRTSGGPGGMSNHYWSSLPASLARSLFIRSDYLPAMPAGKQLKGGPVGGMDLGLGLQPQDAAGVQRRIEAVHQWWLHLHWEYPKTTTLDRLWTTLKPFLGDLVYAGVNPQDHLPWFDDRGTRVSFNELSSGQRRLILLFLEIFMHCGEDGLVLFDEPEAHLHPIWQQMLPDALCQLVPRGQIIVATHAPHIVHGRSAHQVFVLGGLPWERADMVE